MTQASTPTFGAFDVPTWLREQSIATRVLAVLAPCAHRVVPRQRADGAGAYDPANPATLVGNTRCLLLGGAWLAAMVGVQKGHHRGHCVRPRQHTQVGVRRGAAQGHRQRDTQGGTAVKMRFLGHPGASR